MATGELSDFRFTEAYCLLTKQSCGSIAKRPCPVCTSTRIDPSLTIAFDDVLSGKIADRNALAAGARAHQGVIDILKTFRSLMQIAIVH
jgi:hypothetical protein